MGKGREEGPCREDFLEMEGLVGLMAMLREKRLESRWAGPRVWAWPQGSRGPGRIELGSDIGQSIL